MTGDILEDDNSIWMFNLIFQNPPHYGFRHRSNRSRQGKLVEVPIDRYNLQLVVVLVQLLHVTTAFRKTSSISLMNVEPHVCLLLISQDAALDVYLKILSTRYTILFSRSIPWIKCTLSHCVDDRLLLTRVSKFDFQPCPSWWSFVFFVSWGRSARHKYAASAECVMSCT